MDKKLFLYISCIVVSCMLVAHGLSNDLTGLRAAGNKLVNHKNQRVVLRGLNHAGTEYACVQGWGFFDGSHDMSLVQSYKAWKANAIRVPMNQDCWLAINGVKPEWSGQNYINTLTNYVNMFTKAGLAVILELHWSAPGNYQATKQYPMPDRDHTITFWKSVAKHFSRNKKVIFELFNEPFPDNNNWNSAEGWRCWRDGGTCSGMSYQAAGMQELVNAVRSVGATNLILLGGLSYSNSLAQFNQYIPKDPRRNIAAAWHSYNFNKCNNVACWNQYILPTVKKYPLITTEIGEDDCAGGYVTALMKWLDANAGGNYLAWTFNTWDCKGGPALISSYDNYGTPTPYGAAIKTHYVSFNTQLSTKPKKNAGQGNKKNAGQGKEKNAGQGKKKNAAQGKKKNAAQGKKKNAGQGNKKNAGQGREKNAAQGKKMNPAQGKKKNAAQGKKKNAGQGNKRNAGHGNKKNGGHGNKKNAGHGNKKNAVQGKGKNAGHGNNKNATQGNKKNAGQGKKHNAGQGKNSKKPGNKNNKHNKNNHGASNKKHGKGKGKHPKGR